MPLGACVTVLTSALFGDTGAGLYRLINATIPGATTSIVTGLEELARRARTLSGWGSFFFVFSSLRMYFSIEGAVNELWGTTQTRKPLIRLGVALSVVILGPVAIGILNSLVLESGASFTEFRFSGVVASSLLLALLYRAVPGSHVRWGPALWAGAFAGLTLTALRVGFTRGIFALRDVDRIYGSISAVVIFVLAIGLVWTLLLFGVSLAHALQFRWELLAHDEAERIAKQSAPADEAVRLLLALSERENSQASLQDLAGSVTMEETGAKGRLKRLAAAGLVTASPDGYYRLSRPPDQISLYAVARAMGEAEPRMLPKGDDPTADVLKRLYKRADREERHILQGISLQDLRRGARENRVITEVG